MTEAVVINLFLTLRVLLVGGILLALPHITRKGLLFGVYVGEEFGGTESGGQLLRSWHLGCLGVMALALAVGYGISVLGWPLAGNLTGTAVLLLAALALYIRTYSRTRALATPQAAQQARTTAASLEVRAPERAGFAKLVLGICVLTSLATFVYAAVAYAGLPDRVPALNSLNSVALSDKSMLAALFFPVLNLVVSPMYAVLVLLTATAKRSVRGGSGGRSVEAQDAFRAVMTNVFGWVTLFMCALLTLISVQLVRVALAQTTALGAGVWWIVGALLVFALVGLFRIVTGHGQGGALRERASVEAPLTGGLADDTHWVLGMFYVDRDDPSIMVEKRFGIGYSLNYGNRRAVLLVVAFGGLMLSLTAVGLVGILS